MIIIGIDPGVTGAVARIGFGTEPMVEDLPRMDHPTATMMKSQLAGDQLVDALRRMCPAFESGVAVVEDVQAYGSIRGAASLMMSRGIIDCALRVCRFSPIWVRPSEWQRFHGLDTKKKDNTAALGVARELFPTLAASRLRRLSDHNRAEALLIAAWAESKYGG